LLGACPPIGGSPIPQGYPYAAQPQSLQWQTLPYPQYPPMLAARPADSRQPQIRMQKEDDGPASPAVRPAPSRMPSPAEFGLGSTASAMPSSVDWSDIRGRMSRLNITAYRLDPTATGFRFVCSVPTNDGPRELKGEAATEAEAIQQVLARAELLR
jgi:hypothetical protein